MGVERSMKIFFEGMQGQFIGDGYGPRIVSTPMGPFRWNDHRELWENVNNGMVLNNISFQDMMFMGYDSTSGDNGNSSIIGSTCIYNIGTRNQNISVIFDTQDTWQFVPNIIRGTTHTCPFIAYIDVDNIITTAFDGTTLSISDFDFKYKNSLNTSPTGDDPTGLAYETLSLGSTGTKITINPGASLGYAINNTNFNTIFNSIFKLDDPNKFGNIRFNVKIYNETTNSVIHNAGVTFNNLDLVPTIANSFGNLIGNTTENFVVWSSVSGPQPNRTNGSTLGFSELRPYIRCRLNSTKLEGTGKNITTLYYSINNNTGITHTSNGFTLADGDNLRVGIKTNAYQLDELGATGNVKLLNVTDSNNELASVTWSYLYTPESGPS